MTDSYNRIDADIERLMAAHPLIFRGQQPRVSSHLPTGWYDLVDKLCTDIEALLSTTEISSFEVLQIKEKYATLRFYFRFGSAEDTFIDFTGGGKVETLVNRAPNSQDRMQDLRELVNAAAHQSASICETCGEPGETRNLKGCLVTLCDKHLGARRAKK